MKSCSTRSTLRLALAMATCAALATPAQAALVQGDWDPAYGEPFPNLGWRGTATIEVPVACLSLSGLVVNDGSLCPLMTPVSALVEFYDLADEVPTVETLDFGGKVAVDRIFVSAGQVTAFGLDSTGTVLSTSPLGVTSTSPGTQALFALEIEISDAGRMTEAILYWSVNASGLGGRNDPDRPAIVAVTQTDTPAVVPLPATLSLALAGLALLGATRRRS